MTNPIVLPTTPPSETSVGAEPSLLEPSFFALRDLFTGPLRDVSFPGVDASAVADLVAHAEGGARAVVAARTALLEAQASLASAEAVFADRRSLLANKAQLALAYARVFAQDDPALLAAVEGVSLPRLRAVTSAPSNMTAAAPTAPRRRGRPPKVQSGALPLDAGETGVAAE